MQLFHFLVLMVTVYNKLLKRTRNSCLTVSCRLVRPYVYKGSIVNSLKNKTVLLIICLFSPQYSLASDIVPFSVKRIKPIGSGYIELVGPGKMKINNEVDSYEETKFIKKTNIGTMTSATGSDKGCRLAYSSEGYTEDILVRNQTCNEILSIFSAVK